MVKKKREDIVNFKSEPLMKKYVVSVIIPVYNVASYLSKALESIIMQSYKNLEIIIIDDGSTDGSDKICDKYALIDSRIVLVHQDNQGLSSARNVGLRLMTGDYVVFFDSDDFCCEDYIQILIDAITADDYDMVICKYHICNAKGEVLIDDENLRGYPLIEKGNYSRECILRALVDGKVNKTVWNKLYNKSLWEHIRFPKGHVFEDIDTTYRIINCCKKICVIDDILYYYRKRPGSITNAIAQAYRLDEAEAWFHFGLFVWKRTPQIFTYKQLYTIQSQCIKRMINYYLLSLKFEISCDKQARKIIRKRLRFCMIGLVNCNLDFRTIVIYEVICLCPGLLKVLIPFFSRVKRLLCKE